MIGHKDQMYVLHQPNSALAKGGSGDILCGIIAGLYGQCVMPFRRLPLVRIFTVVVPNRKKILPALCQRIWFIKFLVYFNLCGKVKLPFFIFCDQSFHRFHSTGKHRMKIMILWIGQSLFFSFLIGNRINIAPARTCNAEETINNVLLSISEQIVPKVQYACQFSARRFPTGDFKGSCWP